MTLRSTLQQLVAAAAFVFCCAFAAADDMPSSQHGVEFVRDQKSVAYRDVLQRFDTAIQTAPRDAVLAVQRCAFINTFTDEDYDPVESAPDDFAACRIEDDEPGAGRALIEGANELGHVAMIAKTRCAIVGECRVPACIGPGASPIGHRVPRPGRSAEI